ncbi:MAG: threonine/serine exporter family protein [Candidatus Pseudobacter hemicellulosilyticus]|uniref:Threonine/serine exporter family protein n=1 Tax=Candidatus Pseudobacter hemicellulosilyticus TaxID=3121375 RepID=A0AAJ5WYY3_9BACT|nr:MAG: threonine/serine exporter family protein [Pseudobacter sp.]
MNDLPLNKEAEALGNTLLEISMLLMISGASTGRIRNTVDRISNRFGFITYTLVSQRTITISIYDDSDRCLFNSLKRTKPHAVNFKIIAEVSRISWQIVEEKWSLEQINAAIGKLGELHHYPRLLVLLFTGLATASFCRLAGGELPEMSAVFAGTVLGLFVRQEASKMRFNFYLCVFFSALTASLLTGFICKMVPGINAEISMVTSILFLIPGIPLINAFADMLDGNLQNGLLRGLNGMIISFSIALGLFTSVAIYRF